MPGVAEVHIDVALTNVSVAYKNQAYISDIVAPMVRVSKQSDKYYKFDPKQDKFRPVDDRRAPGAEARAVDYETTTDPYYADGHALKTLIPKEERANADPAINVDIDGTEFVTEQLLLNKEAALAAAMFADANIPGETLSGSGQWSHADSDPLVAVEAKKEAILKAGLVLPNTLILPQEVFSKVRVHSKVVDKVKYVKLGSPISANDLAQLFDVEQVLVPRCFKNTARKGQAAVMDFVWGDTAYLLYVPPRPAIRQPSFAYTFQWVLAEGGVQGFVVSTWWDNDKQSDIIQGERYHDQKIVCPKAAYRWKDAV